MNPQIDAHAAQLANHTDWTGEHIAMILVLFGVPMLYLMFGERVKRMRFWFDDKGRDLRRMGFGFWFVWWLAFKRGFMGWGAR